MMNLCPDWAALARSAVNQQQARRSLAVGYANRPHFPVNDSMACRISAVSSAFAGSSGSGLRAATRSRCGQSFLPLHSRASLFWSRVNSTHRPALLAQNRKNLQQCSVFSTVVRRNGEHDDRKSVAAQGFPDQKTEVGDIILMHGCRTTVTPRSSKDSVSTAMIRSSACRVHELNQIGWPLSHNRSLL